MIRHATAGVADHEVDVLAAVVLAPLSADDTHAPA